MKVPGWIQYTTIVLALIAGVSLMFGEYHSAFWCISIWFYGFLGYEIGRDER